MGLLHADVESCSLMCRVPCIYSSFICGHKCFVRAHKLHLQGHRVRTPQRVSYVKMSCGKICHVVVIVWPNYRLFTR